MAVDSNHPYFLREMWGLYIAGSIIFALRFIVRYRTVGLKGACGDDYFALAAWIFYTVDAVAVDKAYLYGTNVDFTLPQLESMSYDQLQTITLGSKFQTTAWFSYSALIWCTKGAMLFFYQRLTFGLWQHKLVKWLALAVGIAYVPCLLTILFGCRPFSNNWKVLPQPGLQCTFRMQNVITVSAFNIITDVALLSVPLPLLWRLQLPKRQKIIIAVFLATGVLVIAAAIIRMAETLGSHPSTTTVNTWGVRETIVAIFCVNMPTLRPLFTRRFWSLRPRDASHSSNYGRSANRIGSGKSGSDFHSSPEGVMNDGNSEEYIMKNVAFDNINKVHVETEVRVESGERTGDDHREVSSWH